MDQPQSALVLDDELFASAREQWHQSNGQASTSGTSGDYYGLLGVSKVIKVLKAHSFHRTAREVYPLHGKSAYQGGQYAVWLRPGLLHTQKPVTVRRMHPQRRSSERTMCWPGSCIRTRIGAMSRRISASSSLERPTRYSKAMQCTRNEIAEMILLLRTTLDPADTCQLCTVGHRVVMCCQVPSVKI